MFPSLRILLSASAGLALVLVLGVVMFISRPREKEHLAMSAEPS